MSTARSERLLKLISADRENHHPSPLPQPCVDAPVSEEDGGSLPVLFGEFRNRQRILEFYFFGRVCVRQVGLGGVLRHVEGSHGSRQEFLYGGCARDRHLPEHAALQRAVAVEHLHHFWGRTRGETRMRQSTRERIVRSFAKEWKKTRHIKRLIRHNDSLWMSRSTVLPIHAKKP